MKFFFFRITEIDCGQLSSGSDSGDESSGAEDGDQVRLILQSYNLLYVFCNSKKSQNYFTAVVKKCYAIA
jgi:hypothetical protein